MMPVLLLSGILLPMTLGPTWLQSVSDWMPFRWVTDGVRASFSGDFARDPMVYGTAWAAVLFVVSLWWGARPPSARRTPEPSAAGRRRAPRMP